MFVWEDPNPAELSVVTWEEPNAGNIDGALSVLVWEEPKYGKVDTPLSVLIWEEPNAGRVDGESVVTCDDPMQQFYNPKFISQYENMLLHL